MTNSQRPYRKSTRSGGSGGDCVEWAHTPDGVYIRDSKNPQGHELLVTPAQWQGFIAAASAGAAHSWIIRQPDGAVHVAEGTRCLRFTPAEWSAFLAAIQAGECVAA